eukprot:767012-Hanusia_phi.AAC.7
MGRAQTGFGFNLTVSSELAMSRSRFPNKNPAGGITKRVRERNKRETAEACQEVLEPRPESKKRRAGRSEKERGAGWSRTCAAKPMSRYRTIATLLLQACQRQVWIQGNRTTGGAGDSAWDRRGTRR